MTLFSLSHPFFDALLGPFFGVSGGFFIYLKSYLNLVKNDDFPLSLCHLERFANPGYPARADSKALGRAEDEALC